MFRATGLALFATRAATGSGRPTAPQGVRVAAEVRQRQVGTDVHARRSDHAARVCAAASILSAPSLVSCSTMRDEVGVLQTRDEERPAVGALLMRADFSPFGVGEAAPVRFSRDSMSSSSCCASNPSTAPPSSSSSSIAFSRSSAVSSPATSSISRLSRRAWRDSSIQWKRSRSRNSPSSSASVADVLGVVELGEPLDHARQQQRGQRRRGEHGLGDCLAPGYKSALDAEAGRRTARRRGPSSPGASSPLPRSAGANIGGSRRRRHRRGRGRSPSGRCTPRRRRRCGSSCCHGSG